jgi:uncharacterized delta-60 repeat protein
LSFEKTGVERRIKVRIKIRVIVLTSKIYHFRFVWPTFQAFTAPIPASWQIEVPGGKIMTWKELNAHLRGHFIMIQRIFFILSVCCLCTPAFLHADGELDTDFDTDGRVRTDLGGFEIAEAVAIQADDKIVVAGSDATDMLLIRYNEDGSLDGTFSGDGVQTVDFSLGDDVGRAVAVDFTGKIIVAGHATDIVTGEDFAMARLNANGTLDPTFNGTGLVTTDFGTPLDRAFAMKIQSDGKIVLAGRACPDGTLNSCDFAVARYRADGSLDDDFGIDGLMQTDLLGGYDEANALWIHWNGTILLVGDADSDIGIVRYNPDGSLDFAFSDDGKMVTDLGSPIGGSANDALVYNDGRILIVGGVGPSPGDFAIARFHSDGTLDPNFGPDETGIVSVDFFSGPDSALGLTKQYDDKILISGYAEISPGERDFGIIRFTQNGLLDDTFGTGGKVTTDFSGPGASIDFPHALTFQSDGKIVVAGRADNDVAIARYDNGLAFEVLFGDSFEDGILDPSWTYTKPTWSESGGSLIGTPEKKKAEAEAIPAFDGCQGCTIYTRMSSRGGPGNKLWLFAWRENKNNTVELIMKEESDTWVLKHRVNGKVKQKAKVMSVIEPHVTYTIFLNFDGSQFTLTVDSEVILVMPATATPNGSVGYRVKDTIGVFEWLFVMPIAG